MEKNNHGEFHRKVFREEIRNAIKEAIFTGQLEPGSRIIETFWAKELGVSQAPVREAIRDLEAVGLVETVPFKGSRVSTMSEKQISDNYSVRICLESKSLRDAIDKLNDAELSALVATLEQVLNRMEAYAAAGNLLEFTNEDTLFHKAIIEATDNQVLLRLWEQCNMRMWYLYLPLTESISLKKLQSGHKKILAALQNRDKKEATETLENHIAHMMDEFTGKQ
ncbi:MAG: GntR family transcriptional regulator [Ruminococcaceae bacterium]|nr:GntR family transcriptional regulator [Oscillospiraceae bacterium]